MGTAWGVSSIHEVQTITKATVWNLENLLLMKSPEKLFHFSIIVIMQQKFKNQISDKNYKLIVITLNPKP